MAKVTIDANELHGTDVKRVSLVKRAASRLPFRIVKSEEDDSMLDLSRLFLKKGEPAARPDVFAIMVRKGADLDKTVALLKSAGFTLPEKPTASEHASVFMLKGDAEPADDSILIKTDHDLGFVVEHLAKGFDGFDFRDADFLADTFKKGEYMPSPALTARMFAEATTAGVKKGDGGTTLTKRVEIYKGYVDRLNKLLPAELLKADGVHPSRTDAGSDDIKDAIDPGTVDAALGAGTMPSATADDKKSRYDSKDAKSVSGGKIDVLAKAMTDPAVDAAAQDDPNIKDAKKKPTPAFIEAKKDYASDCATMKKWAAQAIEKGDFLAAAKLMKLAKAGGFPADTQDAEGDDNAATRALTDKTKTSGAGAQASDGGANVKKDNANGGANASEDMQPNQLTAAGGTSQNATDDDASNTAVNANPNQGKKDPNLAHPANAAASNGQDLTNDKNGQVSDQGGWTQKVAGEILAVVSKQFGDALGELRKGMADISAQVTAVAERAKKTEDAVSGTVFSEPGRDMTGQRPFFKSEERSSNGPPLLDTSIRKSDDDVNVSDIRNFARTRMSR